MGAYSKVLKMVVKAKQKATQLLTVSPSAWSELCDKLVLQFESVHVINTRVCTRMGKVFPVISDMCVMCWIINCMCRCSTSQSYLTTVISWDLYPLVVFHPVM